MKGNESRETPACGRLNAPFPAEVTCPHCAEEIELWSDEAETCCRFCGFMVYRHEKFTH